MSINIVSNSIILKKFQKIDIFKLNMGKNLLDKNSGVVKISDDFISQYREKNGRILHRFGDIGSLKFYLDTQIQDNVFIIFKNDVIYEIDYEENEDIKHYLSEILIKIDEHHKEEVLVKKEKTQENRGLWVAKDEKNRGKTFEIDQTLSREEYLQEILKRKKD